MHLFMSIADLEVLYLCPLIAIAVCTTVIMGYGRTHEHTHMLSDFSDQSNFKKPYKHSSQAWNEPGLIVLKCIGTDVVHKYLQFYLANRVKKQISNYFSM